MGGRLTALPSRGDALSFAFGPFLLIPEQQLLLENGIAVRVGRRAFELLTALVRSHGQVVSKEELISCAWPGLDVDEGNLKVNINALRRLLGERTGQRRYIATVVGRGYRFIAGVRSSPHHTLPSSTKRIYGRDDAIGSMLQDLEETRLVSIVGLGGVGKTTVAHALAQLAAGGFADGAHFVDLSKLDDPCKVPDAIAEVIRVGTRASSEVSTLEELLRDRELLLLIDNCEHVIDAVASCADQMLARAKKLRLICTSREPLSIRGERVRRLSGLGLPPQHKLLRAADAMASPAVQLFAARAGEKSKSFRLDDSNASAVAAICQRLDGHALAIERVAQRVGSLGAVGMLDHLERRFHMFDSHHEGPARHRTLTANIDASYTLLSGSEQMTMRRLSVFSGSFSLEAACAIAESPDLDRATVIEDVATLVAKSLLSSEPRDGEMHYHQAHVTRAFATEKLIEHAELKDVQRRYAEYASSLAVAR